MKWVVGLDLRPSSQGAVRLASWLRQGTAGPRVHELVGVHVVQPADQAAAVRLALHTAGELQRLVLGSARAAIAEAEADDDFSLVTLTTAVRPEDGLVAASVQHGADGVLIGRHARRESRAIVRLGAVARRLLRSLPVPVTVTPPDLSRHQIGAGPVLAATDLGPTSAAACRVALSLARDLSRDLTIVHVAEPLEDLGLGFVPENAREGLRGEYHATRQASLDAWVMEHGLGGASVVLEHGDVVERVIGVATRDDAPLIVCGSRRLGLSERVFDSSVGAALAAQAPCAVTVVPPGA